MNNKKRGNDFESRFCEAIAKKWRCWVHFIEPKKDGSQPFDVIAIKDGKPMVFDCKTSAKKVFPISRLEYNQLNAFEMVKRCGCKHIYVAVEYKEEIYVIPYAELVESGRVELNAGYLLE